MTSIASSHRIPTAALLRFRPVGVDCCCDRVLGVALHGVLWHGCGLLCWVIGDAGMGGVG